MWQPRPRQHHRRPLLVFVLVFVPLTGLPHPAVADVADAIYFGGPIVTMIRDGDRVEALAVRDGSILATGSRESLQAHQGDTTQLVDLKGRCLLPGFIDPHSHVVMQSAKFAAVNLDPAPIGNVTSISDIQAKLRERIATRKADAKHWVVGWGYDDTGLKEARHPTRTDLDAVSSELPIVLIHISAHMVACNSKALELAGINADTPDPEGGEFVREAGSREPNGVIKEGGMFTLLAAVPLPTPEEAAKLLRVGLEKYAAEGITTAQDGATTPGSLKLLESLAADGQLPIDVVAYPLYKVCDDPLVDRITANWKTMGRLRLGGVKLVADGSIQGYTAYLSEPYYKQPGDGGHQPDPCQNRVGQHLVLGTDPGPAAEHTHADDAETTDRGYPGMSQQQIDSWVHTADTHGFPLLVHCNGDAAIDMLMQAVTKSRGDWPRPELRTTIIHAQTIRDDQLNFAASHGLVTSYFPIHVVFWGDRHRDLFLGPARAARINPARSTLDRGMKITLHHDAPVASWGMLPVVSAAVNRVTSSGKLLGPAERITAYEAVRAVTKDAAWQYFEEHRKGTLEAGKLADMVILDADPTAVAADKIGGLQVLETIKEGETIYRRP